MDEKMMLRALELAREAFNAGEVPVGCVIADGSGNIVGEGRNRREEKRSAVSHAEIEAIAAANAALGTWRLDGCSMYVTLEPCPMCAGAILSSRISKLFYGARDALSGSCGSVINLFMENYGHSPEIVGGVLKDKSAELMQSFFKELR